MITPSHHGLSSGWRIINLLAAFLMPLWVFLMWALRFPGWAKPALQMWHLNGFSPVWTFMCQSKILCAVKPLWHCEHCTGIKWSGVWLVKMCLLRPLLEKSLLPQWGQGFDLSCVSLCFSREALHVNTLEHSSQGSSVLPCSASRCNFICDLATIFPHWTHISLCWPACVLRRWTVLICCEARYLLLKYSGQWRHLWTNWPSCFCLTWSSCWGQDSNVTSGHSL